MLASSVKLNSPDKHYKANQKIYFAGTAMYSDGNDIYIGNSNYTTLSGIFQTQIDDIYVSLATFVAGNKTLASGVNTAYITFSGTEFDTNYYTSAIMKNTTDIDPTFLTCMVVGTTESGINIKLSDYTNSNNYSIDWSIQR